MKTKQIIELIQSILTEPFTVQSLKEKTCLDLETVRTTIKALHKNKLIYVADWEYRNEGRTKLPIYKLGDNDDQARPKRIPAIEATRRYKEKVRRGAELNTDIPYVPHVPDHVAFSDSGRIIRHHIAQPGEAGSPAKSRTEDTPPRQQSWFSIIEK